jgi:ABC-type tungstate transport system substrate-binding protein
MAGKLDGDKFDEMLGRSLRRHSESVPADFTERMLSQIEKAEQRRILARVVWQERLSLAGCIVFGFLAAVGVAVFPGRVAGILRDIAAGFTERGGAYIEGIGRSVSIEAVRGEWQLYIILALVLGFAAYCILDMLVGDRLRMA